MRTKPASCEINCAMYQRWSNTSCIYLRCVRQHGLQQLDATRAQQVLVCIVHC